jgi:hypothetical protein
MKDEEKMCKGSLRNEGNRIKKNRKKVGKWLRKESLKIGSGQYQYPL